MGPLLSIVIPAYNRRCEIRRALESCLRQSSSDFEIVVVDDGSQDGTAGVVKSYCDPRVRLSLHPANRGPCPARNSGADLARGEWLLFLDSDDELLPDALTVVGREIRLAGNNVARLAFSYLRDDGRVLPDPPFESRIVDYEAFVRWTARVKLSDFLQCTRRVTFDHVRFPDSRMHEILYNFNFARTYRTRAVPSPVALVHTNAANRISDWAQDSSARSHLRWARDWALGMDELLGSHEHAIRTLAPSTIELYSRMRATYTLIARMRPANWQRALAHLKDYPLSARAWVALSLAAASPKTLFYAATLRNRLSSRFAR